MDTEDLINRANEYYDSYAAKKKRSDEKLKMVLLLCTLHQYTTTATLAKVLNISRSRARADVAKWKQLGILRSMDIPGIDPLYGLAPAGAVSARALLTEQLQRLSGKRQKVRTLNAQRVARGAAVINHTLGVQRCGAQHARQAHGDSIIIDRRYCPEALVMTQNHGVKMIADLIFGDDIIEVQLSRFSRAHMTDKIEKAIAIRDQSWVESVWFYAAPGEPYDKIGDLIAQRGYEIELAEVPSLR